MAMTDFTRFFFVCLLFSFASYNIQRDNLGPLAMRLAGLQQCIDEALPLCGIVWLIHGEEEIGSPFAHQLYPSLWPLHAASPSLQTLPVIDLWVEETGYFEATGAQRLLLNNATALLPGSPIQRAVDVVVAHAISEGRKVNILNRFMNKAFKEGCPCLAHLVRDIPCKFYFFRVICALVSFRFI